MIVKNFEEILNTKFCDLPKTPVLSPVPAFDRRKSIICRKTSIGLILKKVEYSTFSIGPILIAKSEFDIIPNI